MSLLRIFSKKCNNDQELEKITSLTTVVILLDVKRQQFITIKSQNCETLCVHIIPSAGLHFRGVEIKSPLEVVKADNTLI